MTIKNKDGTPYKLVGPNPLMNNQEIWEIEGKKFTVHNKVGTKTTLQIPTAPAKIPESIMPKPEIKPEVREEKLPDIVSKLPDLAVGEKVTEGVIGVWCLPAFTREVTDSLHGEKYQKITYGNKFVFEAVIIEQGDVFITFYMNTKTVTVGSIVYPKTFDKRWWRVEQVKQEETGEYFVYAAVTDYQPSFSE